MKLHLIQFSAQIGGGDANRIFGAYHKMLNHVFYVSEYNKKTTGIYFHNLWYFSIIFRVARGEINFDNGQGPEFLKKVRNEPCYTIDYTVPQIWWEGKSDKELRPFIANGISECFELLKKRAIKDKEVIDLEKLDNDFQAGIEQFLSDPLPSKEEMKWTPWQKYPECFLAQTCNKPS